MKPEREPPPQVFYTVNEAADVLRVSAKMVRNLIWTGKLPAYKVENCVRIRCADLDAYIASLPRVGEP